MSQTEKENASESLLVSVKFFCVPHQQSVSQSCFTVLPLLSHFIFSLSPFLILFFFCSSLSLSLPTILAVTRRYVVFKTFYLIFFPSPSSTSRFRQYHQAIGRFIHIEQILFYSSSFGLLKFPSTARHSSSRPIRFVFNFDVQL